MQQLSVIDSFHEFAGTTIYGSLALIALVYIWTGLKADFRKKYGWTLVMLFLLCFNELAHMVIVKLGEGGTYYRFFWILSMPLVMTLGIGYFVERSRNMGKLRYVAMVLLIGIGLFAGNTFLSKDMVQMPQNVYKIPDEVVMSSYIIHEDAQTDEPQIIATDYLMLVYLRQYDASLRLCYGLDTYMGRRTMSDAQSILYEVILKKNYQEMPLDDFKNALANCKIDYVVVEYSEGLDTYLKDCGLIGVCPTGSYSVYRVEE